MAKRSHRRRCLVSVVFLALIAFPVCLLAQPRVPPPPSPSRENVAPSLSFDLALQAYNHDDYREALNQIQQAISEDPEDLDSQYLLGSIYFKLQRLDEAEVIFAALIARDETRFKKAHFELAKVYMQKGREEQALVEIEKGRPVDPGRADYETGIVYLRQSRFAEAMEPFKRAALTKPELAPLATTQQAIASYHLKNYKESRQLLQRALEMKPSAQMADEIRKMIETLDAVLRATKPWAVSATAGVQFDDNIFQTPLQQANFQRTRQTGGDDDDFGFIASLSGRYRLVEEGPWSAGVGYNHYSILYADHPELNAIGARPSLYAQWQRSAYSAELEYVFSHYWVDEESWLDAHAILPRLVLQHGKQWRTELSSGIEWHFYEDQTPRDTLHFLGATETYLMRDGKAQIRGGYLFGYEHLGPEDRADFRIHELMLGTQWPVWKDIWFVDLSGRYIFRDFNSDPASGTTEKREDQEKDLNLLLYGQLTANLQLSFLFQHVWNDSNLPNPNGQDLFTYRRAVTSCMLTYSY